MKARLKARVAFWLVPVLFWCGFGLAQTVEYCYNTGNGISFVAIVLMFFVAVGTAWVCSIDKRLLRVQSRAFDRFVEKFLS